MSKFPKTIEELFEAALDFQNHDQQAEYLDAACPDPDMRKEVESLLTSHHDPDTIFTKQDNASRFGDEEGVGSVVGHYKLLEQIGEGGCGVVYVAEQTELVRRRVALKVIKLGMDTKQVVARFEAERQTLALMDHPNIAKVLDAGTTEQGRPYFVMELVRGIKVTDYCDQEKLSAKDRLDLFIKICHAIQHAHQKGVIHRDIKPSNILVTRHDGVPIPKVIDFGIAKATEGRLTDATIYTQLHQFIGTPAYMSPEQAEMSGLDIDTRSDIYSLGVLLYELLIGKTPFDGKKLVSMGIDAMRKTIRESEPARPSTRLETLQENELTATATCRSSEISSLVYLLKGDLDWIVMKCLEKDRNRRFDTTAELAKDILRHLNHEPITARPPSIAYKLQKVFRRNRIAFLATGAVAASLMIGISVSVWQAIEANQAARSESEQRAIADQATVQALKRQKEAETSQQLAEEERQRANILAQHALESERQSRRFLYAANMRLAQQSLKENNLGRAIGLLDRHRPKAGEEDIRGWEWRYLWQQTRSDALTTLTNWPAMGTSASFSPDGSRLAVGWATGLHGVRVDLWDVPKRQLIRAWSDPDELNYQGRVAFSPNQNLLASTTAPKVVSLYDLNSGQELELWHAPEEGWWSVRDLSFSGDGSKLAIYAVSTSLSAGLTDSAAVWVINISSSKIENRYPTVCVTSWSSGASRLSPDGGRLFLTRTDFGGSSGIQCIDLVADQELWRTEPHKGHPTALALSPDGRTLASSQEGEEHSITLRDASTGQLLSRLEGHASEVSKIAFSKDGQQLISTSSDQTIRCWDLKTGDETRVLRGHRYPIDALAVSSTAKLIASASQDGDLMLWDLVQEGSKDGFIHLSKVKDMDFVVPLEHSRLLHLSPRHPPQLMNLKSPSAATLLPELGASENVLAGFNNNLVFVWDGVDQILARELRGSEIIHRGSIALASGRPACFTYNPTRQLMAWTEAVSSKSFFLANLKEPSRRIELMKKDDGVDSIIFSEDGKYLVTRHWSGDRFSASVWNVDAGKIVASIQEQLPGALFVSPPAYGATFAANGQSVFLSPLAGTSGNDIFFFDLTHQNVVGQRISGKFPCYSLAVSPDGRLIAGTTAAGETRLFNALKGELIETIHGHHQVVLNSVFSPDGRRLLTTSDDSDKSLKIWDIGTRQELLTLENPLGAGGYGFWTTDGDTVFVTGPSSRVDGKIIVWQHVGVWRAPTWEEIAAADLLGGSNSMQR